MSSYGAQYAAMSGGNSGPTSYLSQNLSNPSALYRKLAPSSSSHNILNSSLSSSSLTYSSSTRQPQQQQTRQPQQQQQQQQQPYNSYGYGASSMSAHAFPSTSSNSGMDPIAVSSNTGGGYGQQHSQEVKYRTQKEMQKQHSLHAYAKEKKRKKRLAKLETAIAEVQEAKTRIVNMDCSLISMDQQNELVDLIMKNVHVWKVNLKRSRKHIDETKNFEAKMKQYTGLKGDAHPSNLVNTHWQFTKAGSYKKFMILFADGRYVLVEGVEDSKRANDGDCWYRRIKGRWLFKRDNNLRSRFEGELLLQQHHSSPIYNESTVTEDVNWNMDYRETSLNVKRGWQRVSSTYQNHFDEERHGGGEWMVMKKVNQTSTSYQKAFGDDSVRAVRMAGFAIPGVLTDGSVPRLDELRAHVDGVASVDLDVDSKGHTAKSSATMPTTTVRFADVTTRSYETNNNNGYGSSSSIKTQPSVTSASSSSSSSGYLGQFERDHHVVTSTRSHGAKTTSSRIGKRAYAPPPQQTKYGGKTKYASMSNR